VIIALLTMELHGYVLYLLEGLWGVAAPPGSTAARAWPASALRYRWGVRQICR